MRRLVIGCGYLGRRVADRWKQQGDEVHILTRSNDKAQQFAQAGFRTIVGDITDRASIQALASLEQIDACLFAVGMDRKKYSSIHEVYVDGLRNVLNVFESGEMPNRLIYISSTGVYGEFGGEWIDEESKTQPVREGGKACLEAEALLISRMAARVTLLRFAGIYGPERIPVLNMIRNGEYEKLSGSGFLNLIHVDDGADLILGVADREDGIGCFCVSDGHPILRSEYYNFLAKQLGSPSISKKVEQAKGMTRSGSKRVSNQKIVQTLSFQFKYPSYQSGVQAAMELDPL